MKKAFLLLLVLTCSVSIFAQTTTLYLDDGTSQPGTGTSVKDLSETQLSSGSVTSSATYSSSFSEHLAFTRTYGNITNGINGETFDVSVNISSMSSNTDFRFRVVKQSINGVEQASTGYSSIFTTTGTKTASLSFTNPQTWLAGNRLWLSIEVRRTISSGGHTITVSTGDANSWITFYNILPVELTSFTGSAGNNVVNLKWATTTEVNNYGFDVERKVGNSENWEKIGFVAGHGNSNSPKNYSYADKNPVGGSTFTYRLKQVDNDGTFEYSDAVEVALVPDKIELYQNYPNPFNPTTNIRFSLPQAGRVAINIHNMLGEKVMEIANGEFEAGYQEVHVDASGLSSGMYVYSIETNNFKAVKKMVLMK